jgi:hypothetical protein
MLKWFQQLFLSVSLIAEIRDDIDEIKTILEDMEARLRVLEAHSQKD